MGKVKKLFLKSLIMGSLAFGAINTTTIEVEASSYQQYVVNLLPQEQQELTRKYADIFNIDYSYFLNTYMSHLDDTRVFNVVDGVEYESDELAVVTFAYRLAFKPEKLNINKKEIVFADTNYEMELTPEECIMYYSDLLDIDHEIALSISYAECGTEMDSKNYKNNNNPAGIGPYKKFNNKEEGIIYYIFLLKTGYKLDDEADAEFLKHIAKTYCPDNPDHWISLSSGIYNNVKKDYFFYNDELQEKYDGIDELTADTITEVNEEEQLPKILQYKKEY